MNTPTTRGTTRRKVFAIAAGGAALGLGVTATLAAWTDTEWVFGGNGAGGPGVGTSTFSVQQNTVAPFTTAADWVDEPNNPGGEIVFGPDALNLTPGDTVYAAVALRTAPGSIAGDVELQAGVPAAGVTTNDAAGLLFGAMNVRVATATAAFTCDATAFAAGAAATLIADGPLATTGGSASQPLVADAGSTQVYCFEISLPDPLTLAPGTTLDDYMGLTVAPAWEFQAES
ncbi:SipW-dependent-type signal peptide-containing protein [Microbacterium sp. Yaish 1]|uniref:SipW-dependent-type signal peptide-containing protein n=1 Tax=Microbacterium sp. Yaish 1 TaxID=2025014 RepID=UPI000B9456FE|nr:SipW-dependent-type signal peptide-containing protein [Microbacterium sp. Yaish 1]OYC95718.1 acyl-CoA dehydrogenase [Microbacterium sp. Yaish 1]